MTTQNIGQMELHPDASSNLTTCGPTEIFQIGSLSQSARTKIEVERLARPENFWDELGGLRRHAAALADKLDRVVKYAEMREACGLLVLACALREIVEEG